MIFNQEHFEPYLKSIRISWQGTLKYAFQLILTCFPSNSFAPLPPKNAKRTRLLRKSLYEDSGSQPVIQDTWCSLGLFLQVHEVKTLLINIFQSYLPFPLLFSYKTTVELFRDHLLCDGFTALTAHRKCVRHSCVLKNPQF